MIDEDLVSYLKADSEIAGAAKRISVGNIPSSDDGRPLVDTYIWISMFNEETVLSLDCVSGLSRFNFDVEVCSVNIDQAKNLGRLVHRRLHGYQPYSPFGKSTVQGVWVDAKGDEYQRVNQFSETDMTIVALDVEIAADDAIEDI